MNPGGNLLESSASPAVDCLGFAPPRPPGALVRYQAPSRAWPALATASSDGISPPCGGSPFPEISGRRSVTLAVTKADVRRGLYVTGWGTGHYRPGDHYPDPASAPSWRFNWRKGRVLDDFVVFHLVEGCGYFDDHYIGRVRMAAGDVLLLPPGAWHRIWPSMERDWRESWCMMNGEYLHKLRATGSFPRVSRLRRLKNPCDLNGAMHTLQASSAENSLFVESCALRTLAHALEDEEFTHCGLDASITGDSLVDRAIEFIWLNSHLSLNVGEVARRIGTIRRTLERHFDRVHVRSIAEEILWCRLQRAKLMLGEGRMSIKEISYASGFGSPKQMLRAFKGALGESPTTYRASQMALTP